MYSSRISGFESSLTLAFGHASQSVPRALHSVAERSQTSQSIPRALQSVQGMSRARTRHKQIYISAKCIDMHIAQEWHCSGPAV